MCAARCASARHRNRRTAARQGPASALLPSARPGRASRPGALNFALEQTDPRAEWVAVVDADYLVRPDWLRALAGYFDDPAVGIVQAPQAHRDWGDQRAAPHDELGVRRLLPHRHAPPPRARRHRPARHHDPDPRRGPARRRRLGRPTASARTPSWACACSQHGLRAVYVDRVLGTGLVPTDFAAYRRQRRRWAQGAMQILRRHAGALFGRSPLRPGQRYHFVAGWLPWLGDALHLVFSLAAMAWTVGLAGGAASVRAADRRCSWCRWRCSSSPG